MKKVSAIRKNKICAALLVAILMFCCIPFTAHAAETMLTTTVPSQVPIKLEIEGNGRIEVNGKSYTESTTVQVNRHAKTEFIIIPNSDYELKAILYNGENVFSELQNSTFTLQEVKSDSILKVIFAPKGVPPKTGDGIVPLWIYAVAIIISIFGIAFVKIKKNIIK